MPVPEAAVNQYDAAPAAHYDIGPAREPARVQTVADPKTAKNAPHGQLRARVPATDGRHVGAAPLTADPVHFSPWIVCLALRPIILRRSAGFICYTYLPVHTCLICELDLNNVWLGLLTRRF